MVLWPVVVALPTAEAVADSNHCGPSVDWLSDFTESDFVVTAVTVSMPVAATIPMHPMVAELAAMVVPAAKSVAEDVPMGIAV